MKRFAFILVASVLLAAFQNCGKEQPLDREGQIGIPADEPLRVEAPANTGMMEPQTSPQPRALRRPRLNYAVPHSISFGYQQREIYFCGVGTPFPVYPHAPVPTTMDNFLYEMNLSTGLVTAKTGGAVLLELTPEQKQSLKAILSRTVITDGIYFLDPTPGGYMCTMVWTAPYAAMNTNLGNFELTSWSRGCDQELYKRATGQPAGLHEFLLELEGKFAPIYNVVAN